MKRSKKTRTARALSNTLCAALGLAAPSSQAGPPPKLVAAPQPWTPEPLGPLDVAATPFELGIVVPSAPRLATRRPLAAPPGRRRCG